MAKVLTTAAVAKYVPQRARREIPDAKAPGLFLIVQPSGVKSWALRFRRPDGRSAKLTLGRVDLSDRETSDEPVIGGALTLRQARELANKIDRERARGIDVIAEQKAAKERRRSERETRAANSFGAAAVEFFRDHRTKRGIRPRRWRDDARLLGLRLGARLRPREDRTAHYSGRARRYLGRQAGGRHRRPRHSRRGRRGAPARRSGAAAPQRRA